MLIYQAKNKMNCKNEAGSTGRGAFSFEFLILPLPTHRTANSAVRWEPLSVRPLILRSGGFDGAHSSSEPSFGSLHGCLCHADGPESVRETPFRKPTETALEMTPVVGHVSSAIKWQAIQHKQLRLLTADCFTPFSPMIP